MAESERVLTAAEREALARITGGHIKPFNHHPCITCAVQAEVERILAERLYTEFRRAADYLVQPGHDIHPLAQVKGERNTHATGWREGRRWSHNHLRDRADAVLGEHELPRATEGGVWDDWSPREAFGMCEHEWLLRPESDTHVCQICGDER